MPYGSRRAQSLANEARSGLDDAVAMAADRGRRGLDDVMSMAADRGRRAMHVMEDFGSTAQHTGEMMAEEAARRIRDYPVTTVLAAAALGLFTGFLLSRR